MPIVEIRDVKNLTDDQCQTITKGHCPDCNYRGFVLGPRGGYAINIECGGCGARFNVATAPYNHQIIMAQRIGKRGSGSSDWDIFA